MSQKHKKVCRTLSYIERFLVLVSRVNGCISISAFASSVAIPITITSSTIGLNICVITAGIKRFKSIITAKKKEAK